MARLLADENFPLLGVQALRRLGHDVLTLQEAGKANQRFSDKAVLELATSDARAVLSLNRKHFSVCMMCLQSMQASLSVLLIPTVQAKPSVFMKRWKGEPYCTKH